jgi:uncharacterized protein YmfQ (DUF2313 family)
MATFKEHTQAEQAQMLGIKLPQGDFWLAKNIPDTNLYKLLIGIGIELLRLEGNLNYVSDELTLVNTNDLIDEWETEYNIAGSCLSSLSEGADLETRINNILIKISADGTSIEDQFERLALKLGLTIDVISGIDYQSFPFTFPIYFVGDSNRELRYIIVIDLKETAASVFPFTFPITFGNPAVSIMKCFFEKLKPENCDIVYINESITPTPIPPVITFDLFENDPFTYHAIDQLAGSNSEALQIQDIYN